MHGAQCEFVEHRNGRTWPGCRVLGTEGDQGRLEKGEYFSKCEFCSKCGGRFPNFSKLSTNILKNSFPSEVWHCRTPQTQGRSWAIFIFVCFWDPKSYRKSINLFESPWVKQRGIQSAVRMESKVTFWHRGFRKGGVYDGITGGKLKLRHHASVVQILRSLVRTHK